MGRVGILTSIERTAYPRFKRLITAHELHLFFSPTREEAAWAAERMDADGHQLALLLALKSYQRMGRFPKADEYPEMVVDFVRRAVELPEGTRALWATGRTAERQRTEVRRRVGATYDQARARRIAEESVRKEAAAKNRPADLINIALEKVVEAGLELPAFSTFDAMASKIRGEVNASICTGIHDRMSAVERAELLRLLEERDGDGTTLYNRLKKPAQGPTWSHFKNLARRLEWVDSLGDTSVWVDGVASGKVTDFAGEADAADASELRDFTPVRQVALIACLAHKARMRVRDDLATMFCKRIATKIKKAKAELEEIRLAEREIVEALIGNYRTVLKHIDQGGPAQEALEKAAAMTAQTRQALEGLDEQAPVDEVVGRLEGSLSPAVLALAKALGVQAGGVAAVTKTVEGFGGFARQYEQIEKVSAHHGNFWEVLLYGQIVAAVSSFYEYAILAGLLDRANPIEKRPDPALQRVSERHRPFMGRASRQRPVRRAVRVKTVQALPRPLDDAQVEALFAELRSTRDRALVLLMLQGGLRPGEALGLHLEDIAYGRRRVVVRHRDDHPKGARSKSRYERVVDLHEPEALATLSAYVMNDRPADAETPLVFLIGGRGSRRLEPLGYDGLVRMFARACTRAGIREPWMTPHALRHTHATRMWEGGMRELTLQKRLGHASPESTRIYTRVSDPAVVAEYNRALVRNDAPSQGAK